MASFAPPLPGGPGAPAPAPSPSPSLATPPAPEPVAAPPPAPLGTPPVPGSGTPPPAPTRYEYEEDRSAWIPPDRFTAAEEARQRTEAERDRYRRIAEAAAGMGFPEPERPLAPEIAQARQTLERVLPGITQFHQAMPYLMQIAEQLQQARVDPRMFARYGDVVASTDAGWRRHSSNVLKPIHTAIATSMGMETLTKRQSNAATREFITWIDEDRSGARESRYNDADESLVAEFLDDYNQTFIHPLQRQPAGGPGAPAIPPRQTLPPAPRGGGPGAPPAPAAPPKDLDEATTRAWNGWRSAIAR